MTTSPELTHFSPPLTEALLQFLKYHPARRVSRNLRNMLLEYLQRDEVDAREIQSLLFDLEGLFKLLDVAEAEWGEVVE